MHCPFCHHEDTNVIDSRLISDGNQIRRRRSCPACNKRFTTFERIDLQMPKVKKRDQRLENFSEHKLRNGIQRAVEKRPVSIEQIDNLVQQLITDLHDLGQREIDATIIGRLTMKALKALDEIAFVRFASVYQKFTTLEDFSTVLTDLNNMQTEE